MKGSVKPVINLLKIFSPAVLYSIFLILSCTFFFSPLTFLKFSWSFLLLLLFGVLNLGLILISRSCD